MTDAQLVHFIVVAVDMQLPQRTDGESTPGFACEGPGSPQSGYVPSHSPVGLSLQTSSPSSFIIIPCSLAVS